MNKSGITSGKKHRMKESSVCFYTYVCASPWTLLNDNDSSNVVVRHGCPFVNSKWCFQKTLVLAFWRGRIQAESMGVNGLIKFRERKFKSSMVKSRCNLLAVRSCFSFSGVFKTFTNAWGRETQGILTP
jgi:hypothetical protein